MLQFTKEVDYGIQLLVALAKLKKPTVLSLRTFAKDTRLSFLFLQRIAKKLREAKIIQSAKGAGGGYQLAKNFKKINVKEIVEALEGECAVAACLKSNCCSGGCGCGREAICPSKKVFKVVNDKMCKMLGEMKVSEVIK